MANPILIRSYSAAGPILKHRIVAFDAAARSVAQAAAAALPVVGVSGELDVAAGERVDVVELGIADVTFGAAVDPGIMVTTDDQGRAVPALNGGEFVLGMAMAAAQEGDVGEVKLAHSVLPVIL